jgi:hypothetical protein
MAAPAVASEHKRRRPTFRTSWKRQNIGGAGAGALPPPGGRARPFPLPLPRLRAQAEADPPSHGSGAEVGLRWAAYAGPQKETTPLRFAPARLE